MPILQPYDDSSYSNAEDTARKSSKGASRYKADEIDVSTNRPLNASAATSAANQTRLQNSAFDMQDETRDDRTPEGIPRRSPFSRTTAKKSSHNNIPLNNSKADLSPNFVLQTPMQNDDNITRTSVNRSSNVHTPAASTAMNIPPKAAIWTQ